MTKYVLNDRYKDIDSLLKKFKDDFGEIKLDLGCGYYKPNGYIGLDSLVGAATQVENIDNLPDLFIDLNDKLPFPDSSCNEVRSSHFLEHSNLEHIINEAHRVLRRGGRFIFTVPYANSAEGMYPGHNIFLTEKWFHNNIGFQGKFVILKEKYYPSDYFRWSLIRLIVPFSVARKFLFNACWQMTMWCRVKK